MITVKVVGAKKVMDNYKDVANNFNPNMRRLIGKACMAFIAKLQKNITNRYLKVDTGRLRGSFNKYVINQVGNDIVGVVGSNLKYSRIHETGGIIRAKNKPYLRFKILGNWVRTKQVKIPATKYFSLSVNQSMSRINSILDWGFDRILKGHQV